MMIEEVVYILVGASIILSGISFVLALKVRLGRRLRDASDKSKSQLDNQTNRSLIGRVSVIGMKSQWTVQSSLSLQTDEFVSALEKEGRFGNACLPNTCCPRP
ncbi:hypothetical protein [Desulfomonile tiedjei]|uniref:Uncharacterized protein n=1 Tax=Desulfomonile tiedjei (strain ATCC 49306 / DSM 6799 / DCB-1) TaxID=706587 RepID=I4CBD1_DESTA|nr:hypothetical protein [Desulfomonile tiedjei]AFM26872.1 hypothetical protein Desti_4236 [Desulfomonile tiedjei DSM 6799]